MLSPKQIGTICFAVFSILISAPLFATAPDIDTATASCSDDVFNSNTGPVNIEVNWEPNDITLHWYNGDTEIQNVPVASQSCTYDGTLTPPTTIPTKTGYTFKGWRPRQVQCSFASSVCGLTGSAVDGLTDSDIGYISNDGQNTENTSTYGLTSTGSWAVEFTNGSVIRGTAICNSTSSNTYDTMLAALMNETMTEEQAISGVWGSCDSDAIKPSNTFNTSSSGQYCWCKMESYTPSGGSACNVASFSWVFNGDFSYASNCAGLCAFACTSDIMDFDDGRRALFGVSQ